MPADSSPEPRFDTPGSRREETSEALADPRTLEFLATLAHDLKSPLAPLANAVELLRLRPSDAALQEEIRGIMERQVQQLSRLVDGLLDATRLSRGSLELIRKSASLAEIVERAVETSRPQLALRHQRLTVTGSGRASAAAVDAGRVSQAIAHLIAAVSRNSDDGDEIVLSVEMQQNAAILGIRNQQGGASGNPSATELERGAVQTESRGIGWMLAKRVVELHGGRIEVRSEGRQNVFRVFLPWSTEVPVADTTASAAAGIVRRRVLVIDDTHAAAFLLGQLLETLGQDVEICHDALAGLEAARRQRPDIIFSDITMPRMDGYQFARRLREEKSLENVTLVALTGRADEVDRLQAAESGFDHYLVKPVHIAALEELLRS
jgi:two-component system CheB/CheR fusion protein